MLKEIGLFLFCLMRQKHYWSYFAYSQIQLIEDKIVPVVLIYSTVNAN